MKIQYISLMLVGAALSIIIGCDSLGTRFKVLGKWKAIDGTYVEFRANGTLQYTVKGQVNSMPGRWIFLDDGRLMFEITLPSGFQQVETGVLTKDNLMGYSLVMDIDGVSKIYIKLE